MAAACSTISFSLYAHCGTAENRRPPDNAPAIRIILEGNRRVFVNDPPEVSTGSRLSPSLAPAVENAIQQAASRNQVDADLVRSVAKVESNFNPQAISPKGAMGVMQLMPATAHRLGVADPFDIEQNVEGGVRHLRDLLASYGGDVDLTLAAYNAGEGAVARSGGVPNFRETREYVRRVGSLYRGNARKSGAASLARVPSAKGRAPVVVQRDSRGVWYISNTD